MLHRLSSIMLALFTLCVRLVNLVARGLHWIARQLFGSVHWQAPGWLGWSTDRLRPAGRWLSASPRRALGVLLAVLLALAASYAGWHWYQQLPKPVLTAYEVKTPSVTVYDDNNKPVVYPLQIVFSESVAPVEMIGKDISQGVRLSPQLAGSWIWDDDKTLSFRPKADWPVDVAFQVDMAKKQLLAPQVKLDNYQPEFRSAAFSAAFQQAEFYQDPIDPNLKKLVASVHFSHPVDSDDLKSRISIKLGGGLGFLGLGEAPQFTVSYDKLKLNAYIHSAPLAIPKEDTQLTVTLDKGVRSTRGGNRTEAGISQAITVPGLYSLRMNDISMTLVDNERFEPEQVLLLDSSAAISDNALAGKVHVWLLPEFHPDTPAQDRKQPYAWYNDKVSKDILASAEPLEIKALPSEDSYSPLHSFKFKAPVGRYLYIKVDAGLQAFGGYQSRQPALATLQVQAYPKAVKLLSQGALLSLSGERKLGYMTRGLNGVKIEIGRVLPNQLHHLVDQNRNNFAQPDVYEDMLDTLVERYEDKRALVESEYGKPSYDSLDFGRYLKEKSSHSGGVFMVKMQGYDPKQPDNSVDVEPDTRFILVTDIGIIAKQAVDGSQDVFVQSIASGQPIANARVEVVGRNGEPAMVETTDASGHVHFSQLGDLRREKQALMYVVTKDSDMSFLPINRWDRRLNLSRFDIGGVDNAATAQQLSAYAFTDRGIYRPGETAHIGLIARTADWAGQLQGVPLEVEITDQRGLPVHKQRLRLGQSGFESLDFSSRDTSATGDYQVGIYLVSDDRRDRQLGSTSFKVREFEPDRLKVTATLADQSVVGWIKPEQAKARIRAMHLFGSPANDRRVEAEMTLSPALPAFPRYKEYSFQDKFRLKEAFNEKLPAVTTDSNGEAEINLNLQRFARATYRLYLSARVFEAAGGRGVSAEAATLVSAAPYLVGVKTDGAVNYLPLNTPRNSHWLAIDPELKPVQATQLTQLWIERKFVSVLVKQSNGTYRYESRKKETVRSSQPYALPAGGADLALNTSEAGDFALVLKDGAGTELNRIVYSVAGQANLSRSLERNAELQLALNKTDYAPGDTMELSIRAPYVGAGLITIERDKVYQHVWFKTTTTSSVQRITLPKDFEGNGYVSVQFVRDPGSDEIFMSPLSYGVVPFAVNLDARREPVQVSLPELVKPGELLKMKVTTQQPSRVVVFAVDEGILQVARYKQPDPIGFFFQKRALQVNTAQILDLILPEYQRLLNAAAPGGDGDAVLGRHLNPFKKKRQPPVAYWSGLVDVDAQGKVLQYQVPESFNGRLRVFAVAVNAQHIGVFDGGVESRGDLILSPNVPTSVAPGDEFLVSVSVFNNLRGGGKPAAVELVMTPSKALSVVSAPKGSLSIAEQQEVVAEFRIRANEVLGSAELRFVASSNGKQGKASDSIGIRPAVPLRTQLSAGQFTAASQLQPLTRKLYPQLRQVDAAVSSTPLAWAQGLSSYLGNYQYSCTEQLVSKGVPALLLTAEQDNARRREDFLKVLQVLRERQNEDGSFGLWSANMQVEPLVSIYAVHYLLQAREHGLAVPDDMLANANQWLQQYAVGGSSGLAGVRNRAYAIYLLTRQGIVTSGMLATLQQELDQRYRNEWPQDLTGAYLAASYRLLQQDALAVKLLDKVKWKSAAKPDEAGADPYYDATVHDAQLLYLVASHFPQQAASVPASVLTKLGETVSANRYHSLSAAYLIIAFDRYARIPGNQAAKLGIAELNARGDSSVLPLSGGLVKQGAVSAQATSVKYSKDGSLPAYYLLSENGFDRQPPAGGLSQGLEIAREYTTLDGKPLVKAKVGEEFLVKLSLRSTERDTAAQVAVVDLLPGGIEPVLNARAESSDVVDAEAGSGDVEAWQAPLGDPASSSWRPSFADIREDRLILYGTFTRDVSSFVYRVRATNAGSFVVPAPFAEGMYDRRLQGRGASGKLEVVKP